MSVCLGRYVLCLVYGKSSVIGLCVVIVWGVVGGGLIVVCRCGSVCKQIKVRCYSTIPTCGDNTMQSSAPEDGHVVARNMLSNL